MSEMSEFRRRKLLAYFHFLDRDGDGYITMADFIENMSSMKEIGRLGEEEHNTSRKEALSWWFLYYDEAHKNGGKVDDHVFMRVTVEFFTRNESVTPLVNHYTTMFNSIDINKDGEISEDELMIYYKAYNVHDENHIRKIFKQLDIDGDGTITKEEFIHAGKSFWFSDDTENGFEFLHQLPGKPTTLSNKSTH